MSKEMIGRMRKFLDSLEAEGIESSPAQMQQANVVQNAMNMGSESPNSPNLSDDAENKNTGGFKSNSSAVGMGDDEVKKKAFVAMMKNRG